MKFRAPMDTSPTMLERVFDSLDAILARLFPPAPDPELAALDDAATRLLDALRNATPEERGGFQRTIRDAGFTTEEAARAFQRMARAGFRVSDARSPTQ